MKNVFDFLNLYKDESETFNLGFHILRNHVELSLERFFKLTF